MLTIDALEALGIRTGEGLARCMNNETFYFRMIRMAVDDANFEKLRSAVAANDLDAAFEAAHALKGVAGNLSLTTVYEPLLEMTELLRARSEADYAGYLEKIRQALEPVKALCAD